MHTVRFLTLYTLTLATIEAFANLQVSVPQSWLKANVSLPTQSHDSLQITFSPEIDKCRANYGSQAYAVCARPFGLDGRRVTGVRLEPQLAGTWRWRDSTTLSFTPTDAWPEKTAFKVVLDDLRLPVATTLTNPQVTFSTPPLTMSGHMTFWLDPAVDGDRALSIDASLSTVVHDTTAFERSTEIQLPIGTELRLKKPTFIWNHNKTQVYIRLPIERLGSQPTNVTVRFPMAVARWEANKTGRPVVKPGFEVAQFNHTVPASHGLYAIKDVQLYPTRTNTLESVYQLTLRPSLLTKPADLLKVLRVTVLPARLNDDAVSPTDWQRAPVITNDVLTRGTPVSLELKTDPEIPTDKITLNLRAPKGQYLHVALPQGFGPRSDTVLIKAWHTVMPLHDPGAEVGFLAPGHMMTLSGKRSLTLLADGVDRLRWRIERIRDPFLAMLATQYRAHEFSQQADTLADAKTGEIPLIKGHRFASLSFDVAALPGQKSGLFQVTLVGEKKTPTGWEEVAQSQKRVLVTNTGLIAKTSREGLTTVFTTNLVTGSTTEGIDVSLLGANGVPLQTVKTDSQGIARFHSTKGLTREKAPTAIVTMDPNTGDLAWLSLADASNVDHMIDLETSGRQVADDGLTGLVFADRGLYRPGDEVHTGVIVKTADWHSLPQGLPLTLRATDTAGNLVFEKAVTLTPEGTTESTWSLPKDVLPGNLRVDLLAGETVLSTHNALIGDFTPESMRLSATIKDQAPGWLLPGDLLIDSHLTMNYGATAANRLVSGRAAFSSAGELQFPGWSAWTFVDPTPFEGHKEALTLKAQTTDNQGKASITVPIATEGTLRTRILLEGFEVAGTRAATENLDFIVSPATEMLGYQTKDASPSLFNNEAGVSRVIDFCLIDRFLKPRPNATLIVTTARHQSVTELSTDSQGMLRYSDRTVETPVSTTTLTTDANGQVPFELDTQTPGAFVLLVQNAQGQPLAKLPYEVAGDDLRPVLANDVPDAPLRLRVEKDTLEANETASIQLTSPFDGMALLTLESDRILTSKWVKVKRGNNKLTLTMPQDVNGRAWLYTSLIRSSSEAHRYLKAYTRSAVPVMLNLKKRALDLTLEAPKAVTHTKVLQVTVKTSSPSRVFLWAVDEGILSLTGYRTPNPVDAILKDRALQVETRQTLDTLIPEGIKLPSDTTYGGGLFMAKDMANALANPFRRTAQQATVWWAGSVETDANGRTLNVRLPEVFNGRVRLMATGASIDQIGHTETQVEIRSPQILTPILPLFATPGDTFRAIATLRSDTPWTGTVTMTPPKGFKVDASSNAVQLSQAGEACVWTDFTVGLNLGNTPVTVTAKNQTGETLERTETLSVRPPVPRMLDLHWATFGAETTKTLPSMIALAPTGETTSATISTTPLPLVLGLMQGLPRPKWASPETAIGAAHAWALLRNTPEVSLTQPPEDFVKEADQRINEALQQIRDHMQWNGLAPWHGDAPSLLTSAWALDFLLTLREKQIGFDPNLLTQLTQALSNHLDGFTPETLDEARTVAWSLALLTRAGSLEVERIEALRRRMDARQFDWQHDLTALYLAHAYRLMRLTEEANSLERNTIQLSVNKVDGTGAQTLGGLPALAALSRLNKKTDQLLGALNTRNVSNLSVRERALVAAALASLTQPSKASLDNVSLTCVKPDATRGKETMTRTDTRLTLTSPGCPQFQVVSQTPLKGLYWQTTASGWPVAAPTEAVEAGIEVTKRLLNEAGQLVTPETPVKPGDILTVEIRARRVGETFYTPVILTDLLPTGFALLNPKTQLDGMDVMSTHTAEDRLVGVVRLNQQESVFTYDIRAQTVGTFTVPPVVAEDGTDPALHGRDKGSTLTVKP